MGKVTELHINGTSYRIGGESERSLLSVLRDDLDLTGTKYGCGEGQCGACTVLVEGLPTRSCTTNLGVVEGKKITTIEGLEENDHLHPLQVAFLEVGAMQCGYCTSGMILSGVALLSQNPDPTEQEIVRFMEGNICRCGTYSRIIAAIHKAGRVLRGDAK